MGRSLGIAIDTAAGIPLHRQIAEAIAERIRSGALPAGFRLAPTRALAGELAVHRNTIVRAYEELATDGLLVSMVGRGTFVAEPPVAPAEVRAPATTPLPWAALMSRRTQTEPLIRADRLARQGRTEDTIDLALMQPPAELLPQDLLRRCLEHVLRQQGARALAYAPREGIPRLRQLIAQRLGAMAVPAEPDAIMITTGSQQALDLLARALIDPGDVFLVDEFTYSGALGVLSAAGARVVPVPGDEDGPDPDALRRLAAGAKGFYLMPNCANPTGRCISVERRRALVAWSQASGVPLIEDDYGADLAFDGAEPPPALRALDGQVTYVGSFSKKLIPALRVGFIVCPAELQRHLTPLKHAMDLGTSALLQYALAEFLERGYLRRHLLDAQRTYSARRDALAEALAGLPADVSCELPRFGLALWIALPDSIDADAVFDAALRRGVLVTPGSLCAAAGQARNGLRAVFCAEPPERLLEGGRRLVQAIHDVRARGPATSHMSP